MGTPRGGVAVAAEIAGLLAAELDVVVARKVGALMQPELALAAVTAGGARFTNMAVVRAVGVSHQLFRILADEERAPAHRGEHRLRAGRPAPRLMGRTVILVDDGLATWATMRAAVRARAGLLDWSWPCRAVHHRPARCSEPRPEVVCLLEPESYRKPG